MPVRQKNIQKTAAVNSTAASKVFLPPCATQTPMMIARQIDALNDQGANRRFPAFAPVAQHPEYTVIPAKFRIDASRGENHAVDGAKRRHHDQNIHGPRSEARPCQLEQFLGGILFPGSVRSEPVEIGDIDERHRSPSRSLCQGSGRSGMLRVRFRASETI